MVFSGIGGIQLGRADSFAIAGRRWWTPAAPPRSEQVVAADASMGICQPRRWRQR
jgi:hypothetical protein